MWNAVCLALSLLIVVAIPANLVGQAPEAKQEQPGALEREIRAIDGIVARARVDGIERAEEHAAAVAVRMLHADGRVRDAAVRALLQVVPQFKSLRDKLLRIVAAPPTPAGMWCAGSGVRVLDPSRYVRKLRSIYPEVRAEAVVVVCRGMPGNMPMLRRILEMQWDRSPLVRSEVARWISRIGWNGAVRASLGRALKDRCAEVRQAAAEGMRSQDELAIVDLLRGALHDPSEQVRVEVVVSLGSMKGHGSRAALDLVATLRDRCESVRIATLAALARLEISSDAAKLGVLRLLEDGAPPEQLQALRTIEVLAAEGDGCFSAVLRLGGHGEKDVRQLALETAWSLANSEQRGLVILKAVASLNDQRHRESARSLLCRWIHSRG